MLRRRDGLLVRARVRRDLELPHAFYEATKILATALVQRRHACDEAVQDTAEGALEHVATVGKRGNPPVDRPDVHHVVDHEDRERSRKPKNRLRPGEVL